MGLVLPASAARPRSGAWSGTTTQGRAINFAVSKGNREVSSLRVSVEARWARGTPIVGEASFAGPFPVRGGRFRVPGGEIQIRGHFAKKGRAEGTLRWRGRTYNSSWKSRRCDSRTVRWSARRPGA